LLCQIADDREVERYRRSVGHIRTNRAVRASPRITTFPYHAPDITLARFCLSLDRNCVVHSASVILPSRATARWLNDDRRSPIPD
jgi:hypothetical protein